MGVIMRSSAPMVASDCSFVMALSKNRMLYISGFLEIWYRVSMDCVMAWVQGRWFSGLVFW